MVGFEDVAEGSRGEGFGGERVGWVDAVWVDGGGCGGHLWEGVWMVVDR